jgi:beta-galactosidase
MLGSMPAGDEGDAMLRKLIDHYAAEAGVAMRTDVTEGTVVAPRDADGLHYWFIVNMNGLGGRVTIPQQGTDALTGQSIQPGELKLGKYEYRIIQFDGHP